MSRFEQINGILGTYLASTPDLEGVAIVTSDGLVVASRLANSIPEERAGAMAAALLSLGERAAGELQRGQLNQVYIQGTKGYVMVGRINEQALLVTLTNERAKLGLVFLDMNRVIGEVAKIL